MGAGCIEMEHSLPLFIGNMVAGWDAIRFCFLSSTLVIVEKALPHLDFKPQHPT